MLDEERQEAARTRRSDQLGVWQHSQSFERLGLGHAEVQLAAQSRRQLACKHVRQRKSEIAGALRPAIANREPFLEQRPGDLRAARAPLAAPHGDKRQQERSRTRRQPAP